MQTEIRLLVEEQSDLSLHCLPFCLHLLEAFCYFKPNLFAFKGSNSSVFGVQKFHFHVSDILTTSTSGLKGLTFDDKVNY